MNRDSLLAVVAEWLEEFALPPLVQRQLFPVDPDHLKHILAIVGPRRAGKTYFMYQLIQSLLDTGNWAKQDILFVDFEDYRLSGFLAEDLDELLAAFQQLTGQYPRFLFFDEVQHIPEWGQVLRTLHNRRRQQFAASEPGGRYRAPWPVRGHQDVAVFLCGVLTLQGDIVQPGHLSHPGSGENCCRV